MSLTKNRPIKIAIMALGGQGGGVLSAWLVALMERAGYVAQSTSVPGVAQRTGATIYYIEAFSKAEIEAAGREPVMALMPVPDDVDIVLAAELMEAGRAVLRGLVTTDRTTLIASTHRIYAISEKSAMGDGTAQPTKVLTSAERNSKRLIGFDMQAIADASGAVISAPLFGALAGSKALPFDRSLFEETIRAGGVAVDVNLKAFDLAYEVAESALLQEVQTSRLQKNRPAGNRDASPVLKAINESLSETAREVAREGASRCADFQSRRYAHRYVDRLIALKDACKKHENADLDELMSEFARALALWMTYEDAIRVADLKIRRERFERVREEAHFRSNQVIHVSEFLHPRVEEICDIIPAPLGVFIMRFAPARKLASFLFVRGRRVPTTKLRGFLQLYFIASLRPMRPISLRFKETQTEIEIWIERIIEAFKTDRALAIEIVKSQNLLKGYGDTYMRGRSNFEQVMSALDRLYERPDAAESLRRLNAAALADEQGLALSKELKRLYEERPVAA